MRPPVAAQRSAGYVIDPLSWAQTSTQSDFLEKRLLGDLQMTSLEMLVFIPAAIGGVVIAMVVLYDLLKG